MYTDHQSLGIVLPLWPHCYLLIEILVVWEYIVVEVNGSFCRVADMRFVDIDQEYTKGHLCNQFAGQHFVAHLFLVA